MIDNTLSETKEWLDHNKLADIDEIEMQMKSLQKIIEPIVSNLYKNQKKSQIFDDDDNDKDSDDNYI
jgi:hypothetical protein